MAVFEFHYDFGSPNAYLSHKLIPGVVERTGIACTYVPILLGGVFKLTGNQPPMVQFKDIRNKNEYQRLEIERFVRRHGLSKFRMNPHFPVNTVQVMRGAIAAEEAGAAPAYIDAVFTAMWEDGRKMDDADVIRATLEEAGLDGERLLASIQDQDIKDRLLQNTNEAVERGVFGSPTFFAGSEMFFGKDRLRDVEDELNAQKAA